MKDASQYPITTGYGQIPGYPLNGGFHRGVDRACPTGTPLIVNGIMVAKTGNTGASTGAHLHLGRFVNGQPTNPGTNGFILDGGTVLETGQDSTSGKFIKIRDNAGVVWFYCHLSEILTKAGDVIGMSDESIKYVFMSAGMSEAEAKKQDFNYWRANLNKLGKSIYDSPWNDEFRKKALAPTQFEELPFKTFKAK